jgi:hypothetical protein
LSYHFQPSSILLQQEDTQYPPVAVHNRLGNIKPNLIMDATKRKVSSEQRRKVDDSLRNMKLPEIRLPKPDLGNEATNTIVNDAGASDHGKKQDKNERFHILALVGDLDTVH